MDERLRDDLSVSSGEPDGGSAFGSRWSGLPDGDGPPLGIGLDRLQLIEPSGTSLADRLIDRLTELGAVLLGSLSRWRR
jgi:hypothetical protein